MSKLCTCVFRYAIKNFSPVLPLQTNTFCRIITTSHQFFSDSDEETNDYFKNMSEEYMYLDESLDRKRARLHWQSRKRGIAETCLIFSTFSFKHLNSFSKEQVEAYDRLLNEPSNDWDIYYWMVGHKPVPKEYDTDIMKMLKEHCRNERKEQRFEQPPLNYNPVSEC